MQTTKKTLLWLIAILFSLQHVQAQNCTACFTATVDSLNPFIINVDASCSSLPTTNASYEWYVDQVYIATYVSPQLQLPVLSNGNHNIMLVTYAGACVDTAYQTIVTTPSCSAQFYAYNNTPNSFYFYALYNYSPSSVFSWDFGDGSPISNDFYQTYHAYANTGNYNVCVTVQDTVTNCTSSYCGVVNVSTTTAGCIANVGVYVDPISGSLYADGAASYVNYPYNYYTFSLNGIQVQQGNSPYYTTMLTSSGLYAVTLSLTDSMGNVCDSITQTINYNALGTQSCYPCFNYTYNLTYDSLYIDAGCSIIPSGGSIVWNINGQTANAGVSAFWQGFQTSGIQLVTLYVLDSTNQICDSLSQYLYTYAPPCNSCISVSQVAGSTSDYIFDGTCNTNAAYYTWTVNGQLITYSASPVLNYTFSQSGQYNVCLITSDSLGYTCTAACTTVTVNTPTQTQFSINGTIYKVNNTFTYAPAGSAEAKVYLIKLITGGQLEAIDSTVTNNYGQYTFTNKPIDDYRIKVALQTSSPDYAYNIPTYISSAVMWYDANVVTLINNTYGKDIYMQYGANTGGNGFISGNVFGGANKKRSPADVTLILVDQSTNTPIAYTKPGANGYYEFANIPMGNYKVYGELLNRASIPDNITVSATQMSHTGKNFVYTSTVIQPTNAVLSTNNIDETLNWNISPNPTQGLVQLSNLPSDATVSIFDLVGKLVYNQQVKANTSVSIDTKSWDKGIYMIRIQEGNRQSAKKLMVQ